MMTWDELEASCVKCKKCPLCETRHNVVFGVGDREAEVMLIGEAPGESEDLKGEPFVGRAGKLLDDMLAIIGIDRSMVYITNTLKCRPPGNRDPLNTEKDACADWLWLQTELIRPKITVCLGRISACSLIDESFKITEAHGRWFDKNGTKYTAVYHPSALLRDPRRRPEAFDDLKAILRMIREICPKTAARLRLP